MTSLNNELDLLISNLPNPDRHGKLTQVDKDVVDAIVEALHEGGRGHVTALVDRLAVPGKGNDLQVRYALHALSLHVCRLDDENARIRFTEALASTLGGERPKPVQAFVIRQLQVAGGKEIASRLGDLLLDDELCEPATQALLAIREGATKAFRAALSRARGSSLLTIVQALGVLRDQGSVDALKASVFDPNRDVRLAAGWSLANMGDDVSVELLIRAADRGSGHERIQATKACLLLAERLAAAGKRGKARQIYEHLRKTRTDAAEDYVKAAATRGLASTG